MREILFRGKRADNGEWVEGYLAGNGLICCGEPEDTYDATGYYYGETPYAGFVDVDPATVGQFTGLHDKNGKKIFEGDIIKIPDDYNEFGHNAGEIYDIYFACGGFRLKPKYTKARGYWLEDDETVEIIGNIHDNPELLEG